MLPRDLAIVDCFFLSICKFVIDIADCVRTCPEQYLWSYKRFRIRPPGMPDPYRPCSEA